MNKQELVAAVAERTGKSKAETTSVVDAFFDSITEAMANGERVVLVGFGSFGTVERAERIYNNPQKGKDKVASPAKIVPKVKLTLKLT